MFLNLNANDYLLLHEFIHFFLTSVVAIFIWWRYKDWRLILAVFLFGIFIDIDHWFDYFAYFGPVINFRNFFNVATYVHGGNKVYIPLHGWEFLIVFWLIGYFLEKKLKMKGLKWAMTTAYLGHLLWDNFSFSHHPLAYSFIYRWLNNFSLKSFNGI